MMDSSGIGAYIRGCLPFFLSSPHDFLLFGNLEKIKDLVQITEGQKNIQIVDCPVKPFSFRDFFFFPPALLALINNSDCYYSPFFNIPRGILVPVYTTIHDIIFPDMPELISITGLAARIFFYRRAARKSVKIFTVSEFSKSRIEYHLGKNKPVVVTYSALLPYLQKKDKHVEKNNTIIFIGNIKKHKGLAILLEAFSKARKEGLKNTLIIIGNKDNFRSLDSDILRYINNADTSALLFTGLISDEKLRDLLSRAALLVQPSLYEGFGLPPLEAMSLGTRALISDIPVFKEIYGDFPVTFFRTGDTADLKEKMMSLLYNQKTRPLSLPEKLLNKYTFKNTASVILSELQRNPL
jgi:glycosyltransferase involved in cell wall biosynthesis